MSYEGASGTSVQDTYPSMFPEYSNLAPSRQGSNKDIRNKSINSRNFETKLEDECKASSFNPSGLTRGNRVSLYFATKEDSGTSQSVSKSKAELSTSQSAVSSTKKSDSKSTSDSRRRVESATRTTSLEHNVLLKKLDNHPRAAALRSCDPSPLGQGCESEVMTGSTSSLLVSR